MPAPLSSEILAKIAFADLAARPQRKAALFSIILTARERAEADLSSKKKNTAQQPAAADDVGWRGRNTYALAGVLLLAFLVRFIYLRQVSASPFFAALQIDARVYDAWGQRLAAGDWLGKGVFGQAPLYPYFLGFVYSAFGRDLWLLHLIQMALGAASCGLLYLAGRRFISHGAGLAAGLMLALYPPAIFFDGLIQKAVLDTFLTALLLFMLARAQDARRLPGWFAAGAALGVLALTRENMVLLLPVLAAWLLLRRGDHPGRFWAPAAVFAAGAALAMAPVGLRNYAVGGEFVLTSSQSGPAFYIGNNKDATGEFLPMIKGHQDLDSQDAARLAEEAVGKTLSPKEVSSYWLARAWEDIRARPGRWLGLLARKWLLVWNAYELPDTEDLYFYQDWSGLLRGLNRVFHFGVLCPLAAAGFVLTWRRRRELAPLYLLLLGTAASVALFFVYARYRFPLVPVLLLLAGGGLAQARAAFKEGRRRSLLAAGLAALLAAVFVNWPLFRKEPVLFVAYSNLGNVLCNQGKYPEAVTNFEEAIRLQPGYIEAYHNLGNCLLKQGRPAEALVRFGQALTLQPRLAEAHNSMGVALSDQGEYEKAVGHFREALRLRPDFAEAYYNFGNTLASQNKMELAVNSFRQAAALRPDYAEAHHNLGLALMLQRKLGEAEEQFRRTISLAPGLAIAYQNLGYVLDGQGKHAEALEQYRKAQQLAPALERR